MNLRFVNKIIAQILIGLVTEQILALVKNNPSEEYVLCLSRTKMTGSRSWPSGKAYRIKPWRIPLLFELILIRVTINWNLGETDVNISDN